MGQTKSNTVTFFHKYPNAGVCRSANFDKSGKELPSPPIPFKNHHFETSDPDTIKFLKSHDLYGSLFWDVDEKVKAASTKYVEGATTTGNANAEVVNDKTEVKG